MHMCTFNTYTLSQKLSHLGKRLPIIVQVSLTNVALEFSAISVYSLLWQSPYCLWNVCIAKLIRGIWNHYRYPRPCPVFHCLHYVLPATESWVGAWEQDYSFSTQCKSFLPMIAANKWSSQNYWTLLKIEHPVTCSATMGYIYMQLCSTRYYF